MMQPVENSSKPLGLVWIDCHYPVASVGLARILEKEAWVYVGRESPEEVPSSVILCPGKEDVSEGIERVQRANPQALIIVFGLYLDLALARAALRSGARGFIHAGMAPQQIVRALKVASEGEIVAPRQLLEYLIAAEAFADLDMLSARQREILELVGEGLTNAQIAKRLFLTESTVKQHLRSAYKVLGVNNRIEATRLMRNGG
jgi:DNA-binding NarL/FixJ family response regulator